MIGGEQGQGGTVRTADRVTVFDEKLAKYVETVRRRKQRERMVIAGTFLLFADALGLSPDEREQIAASLRQAAQHVLVDEDQSGEAADD